ncbi:histidine kinase [Hydrogenophaga crassostreae]|uniref:histidine kinase n=1 Tax=Hydrogenophaga crassostreae TaxID=1763535 RepID=A0A167GB08_9BURK|nr:HAMP domain-containing sensor histidine kinase [Hydrogenophaga crassostreae]AOW15117.1 ATP-binding protein [Hydrogenophaga crassostreae]OAD39207.1 histidine kinase [Hydrogenophaga crassostreae]
MTSPEDKPAEPARPPRHWAHSLRLRLLAATLVALALALLLSGWILSGLFKEHVMRQFEVTLTQQLDQLTAQLDFDVQGQPLIDPATLSDPRWQKPYSGLYWQIDKVSPNQQTRAGVLRSRSLWDTQLTLTADALDDGALHVHHGNGPQGASVMMIERTVRSADSPDARWRLVVASDSQPTLAAIASFNQTLALALGALALLLALAALAQVAIGLAPLRKMQTALQAVREGRRSRLQGAFPLEMQPLIDDFNGVLDRNAEVVARARTQAGNLAHALKTPLAVLGQAAEQSQARPAPELAALVSEQVETARRHIDWHLARARVAASTRLPGLRTPVAPVIAGLLRVMQRVNAARELSFTTHDTHADLAFAGEAQDLQEMLGNLLENAAQWARAAVQVHVERVADRLVIQVEDDGPGIALAQRETALSRGGRLDERAPGSGLGLAIVADLAQLYGGSIALETSALGGLRVCLKLPAAA